MKKALTVFLTFLITIGCMMPLGNVAKASETSTEDGYKVEKYDNFTIKTKQEDNVITVVVTDHEANITSTVVNNLNTGEIISDGEVTEASVIQTRNTRIHFSVSPNSVANAVALIAAIPAIISAIATAGLTMGVFSAGIRNIAEKAGIASVISNKPNFNGYFDFTHQTRWQGSVYQARNINRKVVARKNSGAYNTFNFGDGGWFNVTRP